MRSGYFTRNLAGVQPVQRKNRAIIALVLLAGTFAVSGNAWANCDIVTNGLVACYPFNGNANDESGNGNNGTVNGATLTADRFGKPNTAYLFDGINDYIRVNDDPSIRMDSSFTIIAWVKGDYIQNSIVAGVTGDKNIGASWELGPQVSTSPTAEFGVRITPTTWIRAVDPIPLSSQKWTQLVGIWNQETRTTALYRDGVKVLDVTGQALTRYPHDDGLSIGAYLVRGTVQSTKGIIDDILVYNRVLSDAEIKKLYESSPTKCEDPAKHARYSYKTGRVDIPFTDVPLLEETSPNATGEQAVFKGLRLRLNADQDFEIVDPSAKLDDSGEPVGDPCHAVYIYENRTLKIPAVEVPTVLATFPTIKEGKPISVYEVLFQHVQTTPIDLGFLHLQEATLLEVIE